ncbi:MAG: tRNA (5-methylaminomethyl-2-thiouridylate)-methyltransferase, partial [Gammaproteobacteria bacterium]|nr:tRNA (5-methylaminomethyl-2-thiouridylate)-methyltransferase [Gammaproteobacteria bacterium]
MSHNPVVIGLSGGVDSSVSAYLLKEQGYAVEAVFMKNWEEDDTDEYCSASVDVADAKAVCDTLNIPLHTVNFAAEYWDRVFDIFLREYHLGRTPNPDILCNKEIKFKLFLDYCLKTRGAQYLATGHYAQIAKHEDHYQLLRGVDSNKDQSYFIYTLGQKALSQSLFPIGHLTKPEVRTLAKKMGLKTHDKKDSTGICFIGERKFKDFLARYLPAQPGNIESIDGKIIGVHDGLMYYTIGQRKGLKLGGKKEALEAPWYVIDKQVARNVLVVAQTHEHPLLYKNSLYCTDLSWCDGNVPSYPLRCTAKTRYRQKDAACTVTPAADDNTLLVTFDA